MSSSGVRIRLIALLLLAFAFRLFYGPSLPFWTDDERQVYLIGLRAFARGEWPWYGADVIWTNSQIPGALLGWLIRGPFELLPVPEAPVILLNVLSFGALALLAWYLARRLPLVPPWLLWAWLLLLPWTLGYSTNVVNTSYILPGAAAFFVGFFEGSPQLSRRVVPTGLAWALMGAGLGWVSQQHMSGVLLAAYVLAAAIGVLVAPAVTLGMTRGQVIRRAVIGFSIGALLSGSLLFPTWIRDGFGAGRVGAVLAVEGQSVMGLVSLTARVLSFVSFEANRFLGESTGARVLFVLRQPWVIPFVLVVFVAGIVHPVWMAVTAVRSDRTNDPDWAWVRWLFAGTIVLTYCSRFFAIRGLMAHTTYVVLPVAALFAATCWQVRAAAGGGRMRRLEQVAAVTLLSSAVMHTGLAIDRLPRHSLYVDRDLVAAAIQDRNDRYLGERRDTGVGPHDHTLRPVDHVSDSATFVSAQPARDLEVVHNEWNRVLGNRFSAVSPTIRNRSGTTAWTNVRYTTSYFGAGGTLLAERQGTLNEILQPGESRTWRDVADGRVPAGAERVTVTVTGAEKLVPRRR